MAKKIIFIASVNSMKGIRLWRICIGLYNQSDFFYFGADPEFPCRRVGASTLSSLEFEPNVSEVVLWGGTGPVSIPGGNYFWCIYSCLFTHPI